MKRFVLAVFTIVTVSHLNFAQPVISFQNITGGLAQPVDVANANDGTNRLFIVERQGTIRIWNGTSLIFTPFLDISSIVLASGSEQGLLSVAFHPNYATNGYFYVWYNNLEGNVTLARYTRSSLNAADPSSGVALLTIFKPFANHNGADLNFGPDGYLYFGTGDGGSGNDPGNRAQNGDSLHGKMIRIDVNNSNPPYYSIPPTNPFISNAAVRDEIIAAGLRNPWRWSFDRQTGDMWLADVGQNAWEEVNFRPAGSQISLNYGWPCREAMHDLKANCGSQGIGTLVDPIFEYNRDDATGGRSITGGYVYRGAEFPSLQGYYITSDYITDHGWLIRSNGSGGWNVTFQSTWTADITSYGEAENGDIYAVTSAGTLYKLIANSPLPVHLISFNGQQNVGRHQLTWEVQNEEKGDVYVIEKRINASQPFTEVSRVISTANKEKNKYSITINSNEKTFYRLRIVGIDGRMHYSSIITLETKIQQGIKATIAGSTLKLLLPTNAISFALFDASGKMVLQKKTSRNPSEEISLQNIAKGILTIRVQFPQDVQTTRVVY